MKRLLLAVVAVAAMGLTWNLALADGPSHARPIPVTTAEWSGGHAAPVTPVWYRGWGWGGGYYAGYGGYYPGVAVATPYFSYYSGAPAVTAYPYYGYTTPYYGYYGGYYPYRYYGAYRPYYRTWR